MTAQDVTERDPEREFWGTPTLDTPEQNSLRWSDVLQGTPSAVVIQEVVLSGRELDLGAASDNASKLWIAIDRPAQWKLLLPGGKITSPERFDRVFVMRDTANASDATKNYVLRVGPRPGSLDSPTTPTPSVTVTSVTPPTGAAATQVQGAQAQGAAVQQPVFVAGKSAGNADGLATDGSGGLLVQGKVASGGSQAGVNPFQVAGSLNGTVATPNVGQNTVTMSAIAASVQGWVVGGIDNTGGTNTKFNALGVVADGGPALPNALITGGKDNAGNARIPNVTPHGSAAGATPNVALAGATDGTNARALQAQLPATAPATTDYAALVKNVPAMVGSQANAWSAAAVGIGGTSAALDTLGCSRVHAFGNTSGASTITVQYSMDNATFYDASGLAGIGGNQVAANGNFDICFPAGARYVRLKSSAAVTITATLAAKG